MGKENLYRVFTKKNTIIDGGMHSTEQGKIISINNIIIDEKDKDKVTLLDVGKIQEKIAEKTKTDGWKRVEEVPAITILENGKSISEDLLGTFLGVFATDPTSANLKELEWYINSIDHKIKVYAKDSKGNYVWYEIGSVGSVNEVLRKYDSEADFKSKTSTVGQMGIITNVSPKEVVVRLENDDILTLGSANDFKVTTDNLTSSINTNTSAISANTTAINNNANAIAGQQTEINNIKTWVPLINKINAIEIKSNANENKITNIENSLSASDWDKINLIQPITVTQQTTNTGFDSTKYYMKNEVDERAIPWLSDAGYADLTAFENSNKNYEVVKYNVNKDGTNNAEGILFLAKVGSEVKEFRTWEEIKQYIDSIKIEANDFEVIKTINDFTFTQSATGGAISYSEHFGDLDDQAQRQNFMDNVKINNWYTFNIGGVPYQAVIVSGDKTSNFLWTGFRIIDGANGKTPQIVNGSTSATGHAETTGAFTGDVYSSSIALPSAYAPTQMMPTDAIKQLIIDNNNATVSDANDPTWRDLSGTQSTQFNASQIVIDLTNSGLAVDDSVQFLLGSTGGNMVLDGSVKIYGNAADASRNGYVAGQYKWYAYKFSDTVIKFVMDDSKGALTDQSQTIAKVRNVSPDKQPFTAHYTSQAAILKGSVDISAINKGTSQTITLPAGLTTDKLTGISLTVSGSTDWYEVGGWDKVTPLYISVSNEAAGQIWWVEYKIEAVPGDKTKIKVTNFTSGNVGTENEAYNAHWIAFKGGR